MQVSMSTVIEHAYEQYNRCRPSASSDSNKRVKQMNLSTCALLPLFKTSEVYKSEESKQDFLNRMKNYRPHGVSIIIAIKLSRSYLNLFCVDNIRSV